MPFREVVVDTSFVVHALVPSQRLHAQSQAFLTQLSEGDATVFFNRLLEVELAEVAFKLAVKEQHGSRAWPSMRFDGRVRRRAARLMREAFDAWAEVLDAVNWGRIELDEVGDAFPDLMRDFGLSSNDAVHAATVEYTGAEAIVTIDNDFGAIPADRLTILTSHSLVAQCQDRRPR